MNSFHDKVAVVTGGASGIGKALCEELGAAGAVVIVADINTEGAEQVAVTISRQGGRVNARHVDVSDENSVKGLIEHTVTEHGQLDYMFNNAGIAVMGEAQDIEIEHWRSVVDVNLWGVIYGTTIAYATMLKQGSGHIVNMASMTGLFPSSLNLPYCVTKHAVVALSLGLRAEAADLGVKVSVVCPGGVQSDIHQATPVVNLPREKVLAHPTNRLKMPESDQAARAILRGVARNQATIVFPIYVRLFWWLYRLSPALWNWVGLKYVRDFRARLRA